MSKCQIATLKYFLDSKKAKSDLTKNLKTVPLAVKFKNNTTSKIKKLKDDMVQACKNKKQDKIFTRRKKNRKHIPKLTNNKKITDFFLPS